MIGGDWSSAKGHAGASGHPDSAATLPAYRVASLDPRFRGSDTKPSLLMNAPLLVSALPTLRLLTCGSVDDGKSTLIGRMLYEKKLIFDDQLSTLERDSEEVRHDWRGN